MGKKLKIFIKHEEYPEIERQAEYKSEHYNGAMFAFAGASNNHYLIAINIETFLNYHRKDKNRFVYNSGMRLFVESFVLLVEIFTKDKKAQWFLTNEKKS